MTRIIPTDSVRNLGWLAAACFIAGWFLPAASEVPGWMAFRFAFSPVWPYGSGGTADAVEDAVPQVLSALTNVAFIAMFGLLIARKVKRPGLFLRVAIACLLLNLYWPVQMARDGSMRELWIGYYVWLLAFVVLALAGWMLARTPRAPAA